MGNSSEALLIHPTQNSYNFLFLQAGEPGENVYLFHAILWSFVFFWK